MGELEQICFELICHVGDAKSSFIEGIQEAKKKNFEGAEKKLKDGEESYAEGHHIHARLIQQEAGGDPVTMTLLLTHAEDQMMGAELFKCELSRRRTKNEKMKNSELY